MSIRSFKALTAIKKCKIGKVHSKTVKQPYRKTYMLTSESKEILFMSSYVQ